MRSKIVPGLTLVALATPVGAAVAQETALQEITVTATRRPESVQDVASSTSVFSGDDLAALRVTEARASPSRRPA